MKLTNNIYLLVGLGLVAQAIFVVFASNSAISDNFKLSAMQQENQEIKDRIAILENKIAQARSVRAIEADQENFDESDFVAIGERLPITNTLASL